VITNRRVRWEDHGAVWDKEKGTQGFGREKLKERGHLADICLGERKILI
jgi:hypothetical protein